ncbi:histidine kinase [Kribbella sp. NBC_01484]|uniref:sensor histidine kinase n=1 Tax=Kribbella sp. NBC_01484 TaxID=2903579 RepID=UPI002E334110|nr:histidine kinase [Kribbella sp. NBC_01484]
MSRRSSAFDVTIALVVASLGVLEAFWGMGATHRQGPHWAEALLYVVTGALLVLRRRNPLACLTAILVVSAAEFAVFGSPEGQGVAIPSIVAAYSVARWERRRPAWWGLVLVVLLWVVWAGLDPSNPTLEAKAPALIWLSPWVIAWLVGALVRSQLQNAEQRRLAREQWASRAVAEERNRIARELHDVIGHSVSVMTVQASAVRRRLAPEQSVEREALETVEAVGREALVEMRRMVGMLRQPGDTTDREPPPGLAQIDRLLQKFRSGGLTVGLHVTGVQRPVAPGLDLTAYRLIQEGLTNTLRHAPTSTRVEVSIEYRDEQLEVAVRNDGQAAVTGTQAGHGLLGLKERVAVYGGSLLARPRQQGGFELVATMPLERDDLAEPGTVETP